MKQSNSVHRLTDGELAAFERDGFLILFDALDQDMTLKLERTVDRLGLSRPEETEPDGRLHLRDFLKYDSVFMDLLTCPTTFPKVWGILGWNIQLYISHVDITPPVPVAPSTKRLGWHQDTGRVNIELETNPRPRLSIKVGYFLSDTSVTGRGNFWVVPGSHLQNELGYPDDAEAAPVGAIPICVPAGTAVIFDRRLWHSRSPNQSDITRKAVFYGYSYRWLRPRDNLKIEDYDFCTDPIQRQLLGYSRDGHGYSSPEPGDVPLKAWIATHLGEEAVRP